MLDYLVELYAPYVQHIVVIAHPSFAARMRAWADGYSRVSVAEQSSPTGMLDAVLVADATVRERSADSIWVTWADQVGVLPATVARLAAFTSGPIVPALALPTVQRSAPYIHFERDAWGRIVRLLQRREGDVMPAEGESDMGLFALSRDTFCMELQDYAREVAPGASTAERNFLPFVPWLARQHAVVTFPCTDPMEAMGINTPQELRQVEAWLGSRE